MNALTWTHIHTQYVYVCAHSHTHACAHSHTHACTVLLLLFIVSIVLLFLYIICESQFTWWISFALFISYLKSMSHDFWVCCDVKDLKLTFPQIILTIIIFTLSSYWHDMVGPTWENENDPIQSSFSLIHMHQSPKRIHILLRNKCYNNVFLKKER